ncbi:MAG: serine/threonine-protein kinase [Phycisphaerales bacterium]
MPLLPGFVLSRTLGRGGSGRVFLGYRDREGSQRPLAIKVFHLALGEGSGGPRAQRELDLLMQLHLPVLPRVIDYGIWEGRLYIATEYIEGRRLDEAASLLDFDEGDRRATTLGGLSQGRAEPEEHDLPTKSPGGSDACAPEVLRRKIELLAKVADAVQLLHEHAVIHRDLKPGNIMIDGHGQPIIIDLGIASLLAASPADTLTAEGSPVGSPAFMAPEQVRGERSRMSTRTDVYGLGATAYVVLTGHPPHDDSGGLADALRRISCDSPRTVRSLNPAVPRPLGAVLAKAVNPRPEDRYESAGSLAADLRRWLRSEPVRAQPPTLWQRAVRWAGRHPWPIAAALGLVMAVPVAVALTLLYVFWYQREPAGIHPIHNAERVVVGFRVVDRLGLGIAEFGGGLECRGVIGEFARSAGDERRTVLCVIGPASFRTTQDQLWVCDPSNLEVPLWTTSPEIKVPPWTDAYASEYGKLERGAGKVNVAIVADVFPEEISPGPEVVTVHQAPPDGSSHAIRVYGMDGTLHFECWHFGPVRNLVWWGEQNLLVCGGDRHGRKTHSWSAMGWTETESHWPLVLFAVEPRAGARLRWITDSQDAESTSAVRWYNALWPMPEASRLRPVPTAAIGTASIDVRVEFGDRRGGFHLRVDPQGLSTFKPASTDDYWIEHYGGNAETARVEAERYRLEPFPGTAFRRLADPKNP